ncbi:MAG: hypothetical protein E6J38_01705 [Chloroflexi bacterium]|nr:MAG: hypothetical protein E6J38_01705 [Chloroflexota bacterium]
MNTRITRRKVIGSFAAASGALGGRLFGLFPEIPSARPAASVAGVRVDPPPTLADIVKVDFDQAELARRYAAVAGDREIIALRGRAAQEGLHIDIASSSGARASLRQAPQLSGYVVIAPLRKADGAIAGGIIFGQSAEGQFKASLGLQRGTGAYDVYRGLGGNAQRESTISKTDRDITIDFADGTRKVIQIPARPSSGKAGLAAPLATCGMDCLQCNVVCTVAISVECWVATEWVCIAMAECLPCGIICSIIFVVLCAVMSAVTCYGVCSSCC